jgi:glycosyltransferase involved in cell wall biosynthesis
MRILYINFNLNRFDSEAGVWARELVHELSAAGAEVVTFPGLDDTEPAANRSGGNTNSGLKAVMRRRLPQSVSLKLIEYYLQIRGLKRTLQMSWTLWRKRKDLDCGVILARTYEYDWTPLIAARLFRRPLVLEVHTPFYMERQIRGSPASKLLRRFERVQWRAADRIWVNSHELESIIGRDLQTTDRITCIPHGIRMDQFGPEPCRRDRETVSVVFVGSFYHWHGAELLIEAFARSREQVASLRLCLIGDGLTRPACEAKASQLGVCDAVEFTGWIARDRVADYLAASDIGVAPYLKLETFYFDPVKIIEYMATGLAVIASRQGSIDRTVDDGENGLLVPPGDVEALTEAITTLAGDTAMRERLGAAGRQKIAGEQTWEAMARRIMSLCGEAAAGDRLSRSH